MSRALHSRPRARRAGLNPAPTELEAGDGADIEVVVLRSLPNARIATIEELIDIFYLHHEVMAAPIVADRRAPWLPNT